MPLDEGLDVGEAAGLGEALGGEIEGVAGGGGRGEAAADGGEDGHGLVWVVLLAQPGLGGRDGDGSRGGGGEGPPESRRRRERCHFSRPKTRG